jgi:hypothetical protein
MLLKSNLFSLSFRLTVCPCLETLTSGFVGFRDLRCRFFISSVEIPRLWPSVQCVACDKNDTRFRYRDVI